jgi:flagellar basal-body rod protein FlgB
MIYTDDATTYRLDNNNVDIDHEMAEQAKNAIQYSILTELVSRRLAGLRTAISEGRR